MEPKQNLSDRGKRVNAKNRDGKKTDEKNVILISRREKTWSDWLKRMTGQSPHGKKVSNEFRRKKWRYVSMSTSEMPKAETSKNTDIVNFGRPHPDSPHCSKTPTAGVPKVAQDK
jgi:hypothetical protein